MHNCTNQPVDDSPWLDIEQQLDADIKAIEPQVMAEIAAMIAACEGTVMKDADATIAAGMTGSPQRPTDARSASATPAALGSISASIAGPSQKISIRVPQHIVRAIKRRAGSTGTKYQTIINTVLAHAAAHW